MTQHHLPILPFLALLLLGLAAGCSDANQQAAYANDNTTYQQAELSVYDQVLPQLLRSEYFSAIPDSIFPPAKQRLASRSDTLDYYEQYLASHTDHFRKNQPMRFNVSPVLGDLPAMHEVVFWVAEEEGNNERARLYKAFTEAEPYQRLPRREVPLSDFKNTWRYSFSHGDADAASRTGIPYLQLSRVCFNDSLSRGLFYYDINHGVVAYGGAVLVTRQNGKWQLLP